MKEPRRADLTLNGSMCQPQLMSRGKKAALLFDIEVRKPRNVRFRPKADLLEKASHLYSASHKHEI